MLAVELIEEAVTAGARLFRACAVLGISTRTFARWKHGALVDARKGAPKAVPRKLTEAEKDELVQVACSNDYRDQTPYEIVVDLLEQHRYIASVSSFYRVLRERGLLHHRSESKAPRTSSRPPELVATGPNQVWSWDITYLKTDVSGIFLYAYVIIDVWSRAIVGWEIHERESAELAQAFFQRLARARSLTGVRLHADNGTPMKASTVLMMFYHLGIIPSFSRPRVSDDNPYSESLFKTVKYHVRYPKVFLDLTHARTWFAGFVAWYNTEHRHSGIGYVTPQSRHEGWDLDLFATRNMTLAAARAKHPERWGMKIYIHESARVVYLNPIPERKTA
jgi:transposase InsO family protein